MDLKNYYRRIREVEAAIAEESVVLSSRATPDGGREGVLVEAPRSVAARLIVDGAAERASPEQAAEFRENNRAVQAAEERRRAAARIQVSVISEADAHLLGDSSRTGERPSERRPARLGREPK